MKTLLPQARRRRRQEWRQYTTKQLQKQQKMFQCPSRNTSSSISYFLMIMMMTIVIIRNTNQQQQEQQSLLIGVNAFFFMNHIHRIPLLHKTTINYQQRTKMNSIPFFVVQSQKNKKTTTTTSSFGNRNTPYWNHKWNLYTTSSEEEEEPAAEEEEELAANDITEFDEDDEEDDEEVEEEENDELIEEEYDDIQAEYDDEYEYDEDEYDEYEDDDEEYEEEYDDEYEYVDDPDAEYDADDDEDFDEEEFLELTKNSNINNKEPYIEDEYIPIQDKPDDTNYQIQKQITEQTIQRRQKQFRLDQLRHNTTYLQSIVTDFLDSGLTSQQIQDANQYQEQIALSPDDITTLINENNYDGEDGRTIDDDVEADLNEFDKTNRGPNAFPPSDDPFLQNTPFTNEDLVAMDENIHTLQDLKQQLLHNSTTNNTNYYTTNQVEIIHENLNHVLDQLNQSDPLQFQELWDVFDSMDEEGEMGPDEICWLLYDLQFNVTNLVLASCKVKPESPIIQKQWLPQIMKYTKYADQRQDFLKQAAAGGNDELDDDDDDEQERLLRHGGLTYDWDDADMADEEELKRYYQGIGYDTIPTMEPQETNIISCEPADEDEIQMAALEEWMKEVYDPEEDETYYDDENFQPHQNVFAPDFGQGQISSAEKGFQEAYKEFTEDFSEESKEWRDSILQSQNFTNRILPNTPEAASFQGHLIIACGPEESDLDTAEQITLAFEKEFGKRIFVETRLYNHAKPDDFLFEVWIESYDIELLHSRRRATFSSKTWTGPADCDEKQVEYLVREAKHMISDDRRYSFDLFEYEGIEG